MLNKNFLQLKKRTLDSEIIFEFKTLGYNTPEDIQCFSMEDMGNIRNYKDQSIIPDIQNALIWVPGNTRIKQHDTDEEFSIEDDHPEMAHLMKTGSNFIPK